MRLTRDGSLDSKFLFCAGPGAGAFFALGAALLAGSLVQSDLLKRMPSWNERTEVRVTSFVEAANRLSHSQWAVEVSQPEKVDEVARSVAAPVEKAPRARRVSRTLVLAPAVVRSAEVAPIQAEDPSLRMRERYAFVRRAFDLAMNQAEPVITPAPTQLAIHRTTQTPPSKRQVAKVEPHQVLPASSAPAPVTIQAPSRPAVQDHVVTHLSIPEPRAEIPPLHWQPDVKVSAVVAPKVVSMTPARVAHPAPLVDSLKIASLRKALTHLPLRTSAKRLAQVGRPLKQERPMSAPKNSHLVTQKVTPGPLPAVTIQKISPAAKEVREVPKLSLLSVRLLPLQRPVLPVRVQAAPVVKATPPQAERIVPTSPAAPDKILPPVLLASLTAAPAQAPAPKPLQLQPSVTLPAPPPVKVEPELVEPAPEKDASFSQAAAVEPATFAFSEGFRGDLEVSDVRITALAGDRVERATLESQQLWKVAEANGHLPSVYWGQAGGAAQAQLLARNTLRVLERMGPQLTWVESSGILFGKVQAGWTVEFGARAEKPLFLSYDQQPLEPGATESDRYFVFMNAEPGLHLVHLREMAGRRTAAVAVPVKGGAASYLDFSALRSVPSQGRVYDAAQGGHRGLGRSIVRVVGQESLAAASDRLGRFAIPNLLRVGNYPTYFEVDVWKGFTHRILVPADRLGSPELFAFTREGVQDWIQQLEPGKNQERVNPDSALVIAAFPSALLEHPRSPLFPQIRDLLTRNSPLVPEIYPVDGEGRLLVKSPLQRPNGRAMMVQISDGAHFIEATHSDGEIVRSELHYLSPRVILVATP